MTSNAVSASTSKQARLFYGPIQGEAVGVLRGISDINQAIGREKEIKSMTRRQKIKLIESTNPQWRDRSQE